MVVDDMCHVLNWVGPFCSKHGVPSLRFCPNILFPIMVKQGLLPLWNEACSAFMSLGDMKVGADAAEPEQTEFVSVRDFAPQHRLYTIYPELMGAHDVAIDEENSFSDPSAEGAQCRILGPVYDPQEDFKWEAFRESGLEAWCDVAPFVFFSLGSMVSQCVQAQEGLQADLKKLLDALANRRVIVNFSLPGYAERDNLNMAGWVPQKAILAHKNLQCFISHCGQGAVSEAMHAGVPIVAYPFFHDQVLLAESIVKVGCGVWLQRFEDGPGVPVADADLAIEQAIAAKPRAIELGAKARGMNGFATVHAICHELIRWSRENPRK